MKSRMILTGIAAAALLALPLTAQAADLPRPSYKAPAYVVPAYASWSGFYVGINGGYGFGTSDWDRPPNGMDVSGGQVGGTIGYNFQTGSWVWGAEGDFDWSDIQGDSGCFGGATCKIENDWFGTARVRLGYAGWNNWLPYITGGAAFADLKASNSAISSVTKTQLGWTAGVGIEYAWRTNWSVKLEYLYADLGSFDCGASCSTTPPDNVSFKTSLIRAGINYRF
jgi:outer membrane immunogenic protein